MVWSKWWRLAYICRFANQDIYRLLGRDPKVRPLSVLEFRLFEAALHDILEREHTTPDEPDSAPVTRTDDD